VKNITVKQMKNIEKNYIQKDILNIDRVATAGKHATQLCIWILAQLNMYNYLKDWLIIEEKRIKNEEELSVELKSQLKKM